MNFKILIAKPNEISVTSEPTRSNLFHSVFGGFQIYPFPPLDGGYDFRIWLKRQRKEIK